jgi:hypothetical protein
VRRRSLRRRRRRRREEEKRRSRGRRPSFDFETRRPERESFLSLHRFSLPPVCLAGLLQFSCSSLLQRPLLTPVRPSHSYSSNSRSLDSNPSFASLHFSQVVPEWLLCVKHQYAVLRKGKERKCTASTVPSDRTEKEGRSTPFRNADGSETASTLEQLGREVGLETVLLVCGGRRGLV